MLGRPMGNPLSTSYLRLNHPRPRWAFPLSLLLGVLLWAASLPPASAEDNYLSKLSILSVLAFVPIFLALPGVSPKRAAAWGWVGGFLWEATTLWWLVPTLVRYGDMGLHTAIFLIAGLCLILGIYMAVFLGILAQVIEKRGAWGYAAAPFLWVLVEWLRGHVMGGLPWWSPGYSLSLYPVFLQSAALFGVLGLSFLSVLAASALAIGLMDRRSNAALGIALPAILLFAGSCSYGISHLEWRTDPHSRIRVGYLQPQVPQDEKWDPAYSRRIEDRFFELSKPFRPYHLHLLLWPESCTPGIWDMQPDFRKRVGELSRDLETPVLLGAIVKASGGGVQNGAVIVLPDGSEGGRYAKTHLVPFGEFVPMRKILGLARPIVETIGDFQPGDSLAPLPSPAGKLGISICYEGIFPDLVREQVRRGAEILVNVTNDAWYEGTPGLIQHFFIQRVRAVEEGRYLIRSANGGVSGIVNPRGHLEAATPKGQIASFWGEVVPLHHVTLQNRIGSHWLWGALLVVMGLAIPGSRQKSPH
jgi:apolipoprotein N-acyltransferase